jgi:hypothetical protein
MGVLYMPFFDLADSGLGSITLSTAGESNVVLNLSTLTGVDENSDASSKLSHYLATDIESFDDEQTTRFPTYARTSFAVLVQNTLRALMVTATWPDPTQFTCSFSLVTGLITMSYSQTFGVSWGANPYNALMFGFPVALGFIPTDLSGASSYAATKSPLHVINSTLTDVSDEHLYEPDGLGNHVINDTGGGNTIARTQAPLFLDFVQEHESHVKTYTESTQYLLAATYTHQDLYRQCRKGFPFILYGDDRWRTHAFVCSLRSDGMSFNPRPRTPGEAVYHISYRCHLEGIAT